LEVKFQLESSKLSRVASLGKSGFKWVAFAKKKRAPSIYTGQPREKVELIPVMCCCSFITVFLK